MFYEMLCLSQQISASLKTKIFVKQSQEKHKPPTQLNIWISLRVAQLRETKRYSEKQNISTVLTFTFRRNSSPLFSNI